MIQWVFKKGMAAYRLDERFSAIDRRFESIERRLDHVDSRLEKLESRMDRIEFNFDAAIEMRERVAVLGALVARLSA